MLLHIFDRMMIVDVIVGLLLVASGLSALTAALGLVRLQEFFQRMHAPAIAYTLGSWTVTLASILHFSMLGTAASLNVWLIAILLSITAPVTTLLLARAALFRRRYAGDAMPPPLGGGSPEGHAPRAQQDRS